MDKRFRRAVSHAAAGLKAAFVSERHIRIHCAIALLAIVAGLLLSLSASEWLWILLCIALVIGAELFNTALEALTDLATPDYHPLAKKAKDVAAGAVVLCVLFAIVAGLLIFLPKLIALSAS